MGKNVKMVLAFFLVFLLLANYIVLTPGNVVVAKENQKTNEVGITKRDTKKSSKKEKFAEAFNEYNIDDKQHIQRLKDYEKELNTIVCENSDGSTTTYIFNEAVKYVDDTGNVKDKSNKLTDSVNKSKDANKYAYVNDQNDINTYFPKILSKDSGVELNYKSIVIEMYPEDTYSPVSLVSDNMVIYDNVFDSSAQLQYEATYDGYKENIVIYDDSINTFTFIAEAKGMYIEKSKGGLNFVSEKSKEVVATISPIYVYDSYTGYISDGEVHDTYDNELDYKRLSNGKYEITITVDQEFLSNPMTEYPVYIDPSTAVVASSTGENVTVQIDSEGSGSTKTIVDTPIYNGAGVAGVENGANVTGVIGYVNSTFGVGRMLMRFPGLLEYPFMYSSSYNIESVILHLNDTSGLYASATIGAYEYTGPHWSEYSVYSSSIWNGVGSLVASQSISYPGNIDKQFNITALVKEWRAFEIAEAAEDSTDGLKDSAKGIILKNITSESSATYKKAIRTTENSSKKPYLAVKAYLPGCKGVKYSNDEQLNCMEYAFFVSNTAGDSLITTVTDAVDSVINANGYIVDESSSNEALTITKTYLATWLNSTFGSSRWREVDSYCSDIAYNEWIVCMRVGVYAFDGSNDYDFHFWYRTDAGFWYNKHGSERAEKVIDENSPGTIVVDPAKGVRVDGWMYKEIEEFYNSDIVYYAIKSNTGGGIGNEA